MTYRVILEVAYIYDVMSDAKNVSPGQETKIKLKSFSFEKIINVTVGYNNLSLRIFILTYCSSIPIKR